MSKSYNVAVVGATGAVGKEMLKTLENRKFPVKNIVPLASSRSVGKKIIFKGKEYPVRELKEDSFKGVDIALFSAGAERSKIFAPIAVKAGAVVIDNSSAFRMDEDVPLVVPEVNSHAMARHKGIIANPNCSTIQMVLPLAVINKLASLKRVVVTTFQSVSGAGQQNILELETQVKKLSEKETHYGLGEHIVPPDMVKKFQHQMAYNLIPHIDVFKENFYTKEEMKMVEETRKIMELPNLALTATCVRVPVYYAHSESVNVETYKKVTRAEVLENMKNFSGITVVDSPADNEYPMPIQVEGKDNVFVGRIREDESIENGLNVWIVADNLRKGAALNAVQIAEKLINTTREA